MYRLNMFSSAFELAAKHSDKSAYLDLWNAPQTAAQLHRDAAGRPTYLLHDGPPYANGHLHLGHFVNKTLKDALLKFKRLEGYFAPFVPGFDCHGLPVELEVEKLGVPKTDPSAFAAACRRYATSQVELQTGEFRAFGVAADWDRPYLTMDPAFEAGAARLFNQLPQRVQRLRPVHWCAACGSSLAEAEVEYKSRQSHSVEVRFPVVGQENVFLLVWTTTPYTLPANKAVAFNPNLDYVRVLENGHQLVRVRQDHDVAELEQAHPAGWTVESPYTGAHVPVLPADYVTTAGTGFVHMAPSFGMDDFRVCEAHGLAVEHFLDSHGRFLSNLASREDWASQLSGLTLEQASQHVFEKLAPWLHSRAQLTHEYPHCWRHKKPLFFKASEEWFLDLSEVGTQAVRALEQVQFTPAAGRERLGSMLQTRSSWCLSRTRLWGTPLAATAAEQELLPDVQSQGVEAWQTNGPRRTMDVWFDSGVTHELVLKKRFGRTADVYLEGTDQHRGWFQSSLLTSVALHGVAPYREVVTHGFVVDEKGQKYSKSSGNYVPLDKLFEQHSPDVLRLWALSQDYTRDLKMSKESLARTLERYRKLRNTMRFCLQNLTDHDFTTRVQVTHELHLRQFEEMHKLQDLVREAAAKYDFAAAVAATAQFCEATSSDYFTSLKDALYCEAAASPVRKEAQYALAQLLDFLLRLLMPVLPYTVEEVFQLQRERMGYGQACSLLLTWKELEPVRASTLPWDALKELKATLNQFVERERSDSLKSAAQLDAVVTAPFHLDHNALTDFFGCASVQVVQGPSLSVDVRRTSQACCPRCRRHQPRFTDLLCVRCAEVEASSLETAA